MQWVSRNQAPTTQILSDDGWPYASSLPIDAQDPGRFHALFGRDSLIYSLQVMPEQPDVARATLRVLAALQGQREDPQTDEEQGKIVHEYRAQADPRFEEMGWPVRDGELRYYGSADGTSWFLVVLAALGDRAIENELSACWRAASGWVERALERGRGLVRHGPRRTEGGLAAWCAMGRGGRKAGSSSRAGATPRTRYRHTAAASSTPTGACPSRRSPTRTRKR